MLTRKSYRGGDNDRCLASCPAKPNHQINQHEDNTKRIHVTHHRDGFAFCSLLFCSTTTSTET